MSKQSRRLRRQVDDAFVGGGHQIVKARKYRRAVPLWACSNIEVRRLLLTVFPKLKKSLKQREAAAKWARVICLYFRARYTHKQIADVMDEDPERILNIIRRVKRVAAGRRADNAGLRSGRKGRLRKA